MPIVAFVVLLGVNVIVPILVAPYEWSEALFSYLLVPALIGIVAPWVLRPMPLFFRAAITLIIIAIGAALRPYMDGIRAGWDFTFDNEPEVEFIAGVAQFVVATCGFSLSALALLICMKRKPASV